MAEIYGLFSGRDCVVRYVGLTTDTAAVRFEQHNRSAEYSTAPLYQWFHTEWMLGSPIEYAVLQWCDDSDCEQVETKWIWRFPNLLNRRKQNPMRKRYFAYTLPRPPVIFAISAYRRRYIINVDGFRGIHYDRQVERYFVLIYTGRGASWLAGDQSWVVGNERPGRCWSDGDIWFSHLPDAMKERDNLRQRFAAVLGVKFLPDRAA